MSLQYSFKFSLQVFIIPALLGFCQPIFCQDTSTDKPYLVVLSMDGFRWDYPDSVETPNLAYIARNGVKAKSIIPSFPSVTFPNHYSLATGLYPDHHGIVQNQFFDPFLNITFRSNNKENAGDGRFYGGEPIWVTAEKQHVKSANFYWVGSEAEIEHTRPLYWKKYDPRIPFADRIDTVIHWLSLPADQRPHLIMFYFDEPDHTGHAEGPFASATNRKVVYLDSLVGVFINKVNLLPNGSRINLIITSDHGMGKVNDSMKIVVDQIIPKEWMLRTNGYTPMLMIDSKPEFRDSIKARFSKVPHVNVWEKKDMLSRYHFGTNPRIGELVVLADSAYALSMSGQFVKGGAHGYDPANTDMHGIFYAIGPAFKHGYLKPSFENVHVYSLMAKILNIIPAKNDGDFEKIKDVLK